HQRGPKFGSTNGNLQYTDFVSLQCDPACQHGIRDWKFILDTGRRLAKGGMLARVIAPRICTQQKPRHLP
ncbi:MAG: hypothetical protein WB822_03140, partial [Rhodoplanes sp.]